MPETTNVTTNNAVNSLVDKFLEDLRSIDLKAFVNAAKAIKMVFEKKIGVGGVTIPAGTGSVEDELPPANASLGDLQLSTVPITQEQLDALDKAVASGLIDKDAMSYVKGMFTGIMLAS
jgi:hypothetical protein